MREPSSHRNATAPNFKMWTKNFLFFFSTVFMGYVDADVADKIFTLGNATIFGSGCPAGSVGIVSSTDENTMSVLFSAYNAKATHRRRRARLSCNLAVPVDVKQGMSIGVFKVDYRGYAYVPPSPLTSSRKPYAQFNAEYFFSGTRGPNMKRKYGGYGHEFYDDLYLSDEIGVGAYVWSPCGASTNFRINTAITAYGADSEIGIETADVTVEDAHYFRYFFRYRECHDD